MSNKLKKISIITFLLSLVTSCNNGSDVVVKPTPELPSFGEAFKELQKGYSFDGLIKIFQLYDDGASHEKYQYLRVSSSLDEYSSFKWQQSALDEKATKDKIDYQSRFYYHKVNKDNKDVIVSDYLLPSNEVFSSYMIDNNYQIVSWEDAKFYNGFSLLNADDFTLDSNGNYVIDFIKTEDVAGEERISDARIALSRQLYGKAALRLYSVSLTFKDNKIASFSAEYEPEDLFGLGTGTITVSGDFTSIGSDIKFDTIEKVDRKEDKIFEQKFSQIKNNSFTCEEIYKRADFDDQYKYNLTFSKEDLTYKSYYKDELIDDYGFYQSDEEKIQGVNKINDDYYLDQDPYNGTLYSLLPSFEVSSVFFNYDNKTDSYSLMDNYECRLIDASYFSTFYKSESISNLKLAFAGNDIKLQMIVSGKRELDVTYSNIGSTSKKILNVKNDLSNFKWTDLLARHSKSLNLALSDEYLKSADYLNYLPLVGNKYSNAYINAETSRHETQISINCQTDAEAGVLVNDYAKKLKDNLGFTTDVDKVKKNNSNEDGTTSVKGMYKFYLKKDITINGNSDTMCLTVWNYVGLFNTHTFYIYVTLKSNLVEEK